MKTNGVVLVDGVGRPKVIDVPSSDYPKTMGYAREDVESGPDRIVQFDCTGEIDPEGRMIYRQAKTHARVRTEYLLHTAPER